MMEKILVIRNWRRFLEFCGLSEKDGDILISEHGFPGVVYEVKTTVCQDIVHGTKKPYLEVGFLPNLDPKEFKHNDKLRVFIINEHP